MHQNENKIPVYFLPGLAANPSIFKNIQLDPDRFEIYLLEWMIPFEEESISEYALRFCSKVEHKNAVLVGVSFGGIIAQEMNLVHDFRKIIIISSVKTRQELPLHLQLAGKTKVYIHLIEEQIKAGNQVLYLVPEISLTTQLIVRLKKYFGEKLLVYHSKYSLVTFKETIGYNEAMTIGRAQDKAILSMLAANKISIKEPLEEVLKKVQEETSNILMEDTIARTFKY